MKKGTYTPEEKVFMCLTNRSKNPSRVRELLDFIKLNDYHKIGIANCFSVDAIAKKLKSTLENEGITVVSAHCRESGLRAEELSPEYTGPSCDPKSQAEFLNAEQTDLNINFGLCLGHGIIFQKYSKAPVTTMLVKDACHHHNIMENFKE
jgi:uncharacterized metal-binding protein